MAAHSITPAGGPLVERQFGLHKTFESKQQSKPTGNRAEATALWRKYLLPVSMSTAAQSPVPAYMPARHGSPPAISAVGRKKQGSPDHVSWLD